MHKPVDDAQFRRWLAVVLSSTHTRPIAFSVVAMELCKKHGLTMTCARISILERRA